MVAGSKKEHPERDPGRSRITTYDPSVWLERHFHRTLLVKVGTEFCPASRGRDLDPRLLSRGVKFTLKKSR